MLIYGRRVCKNKIEIVMFHMLFLQYNEYVLYLSLLALLKTAL